MKLVTPEYYRNFKCIAGDCTDTCCAGWEVDVDSKSYKYYKSVKGEFGKRLKKVMVPDGEGGCNFTLKDNRCPFLNESNLCDLYTALGEDKLCETCAEFPRFINEYGNTREMGLAPSCITAGELIFNYRDKLTFDVKDDGLLPTTYNDIDAFLYVQLFTARQVAYDIIQNENFKLSDVCILLLEYAGRIQKHMDKERDDLIANVISVFADEEKCISILKKLKGRIKNEKLSVINSYFKPFKGMEVINKDWFKCLNSQKAFMEQMTDGRLCGLYAEFDEYYRDRQFEYRQLLMYYTFRYFLDSVYDYNLIQKVKNGVVGYIVLKHLDVAVWFENDFKLTKAQQIDMAHLYSRQFEHSYSNYEKYTRDFDKKRIYSKNTLFRLLI